MIDIDTTRKPRPGEINGKDYNFMDKDQFVQDVEAGKFIEHAVFGGNMYGTTKESVKSVFEAGKICILDVDRQGVQSIKKTDMNAHYLFIRPPSYETLESRLRNRGTETEVSIHKRLSSVKADFEYASIPGSYDKVIVNDDLDAAYSEFKSFINEIYPKL